MADERRLVIPDYPGNRQYITLGNLAENDGAFLFLIDYESRTRIKLWGRASVMDIDAPDRAIRFTVEAWDVNCRKHLPEFYTLRTVEQATAKLTARIAALEAEIAHLKGGG